MLNVFVKFASDERGAITVDWTVLSSAAVGLAIATTAIMTDSIDVLAGRMDDELRSRQLSDEWVGFYASHFEPVLQSGYMTEEQVETLFESANEMMNHSVTSALVEGIEAMEDGSITAEELVELIAVASVAYQRNIVDDATLDYYFGFEGSEPYYMTIANAPTSTY